MPRLPDVWRVSRETAHAMPVTREGSDCGTRCHGSGRTLARQPSTRVGVRSLRPEVARPFVGRARCVVSRMAGHGATAPGAAARGLLAPHRPAWRSRSGHNDAGRRAARVARVGNGAGPSLGLAAAALRARVTFVRTTSPRHSTRDFCEFAAGAAAGSRRGSDRAATLRAGVA